MVVSEELDSIVEVVFEKLGFLEDFFRGTVTGSHCRFVLKDLLMIERINY